MLHGAGAATTPPPQWVRVVGGWSEFQFAERRMPTLDEINAASADTPVFVLHLYDRALLNRAALRACGFTKDTPDPPGGEIQHNGGQPDGPPDRSAQRRDPVRDARQWAEAACPSTDNSTRQFMRELNRLGVTSVSTRAVAFRIIPRTTRSSRACTRQGEMTVRVAYNLFTQKPNRSSRTSSGGSERRRPGAGRRLLPNERRR